MVQAGKKGGSYRVKLESIINWKAIDRPLVETEADKVVAAMVENIHPLFGGSCIFTLA
jgi:hypothetical protein